MAEEVATSTSTQELQPSEAIGILAQALEAEGKQQVAPRDEQGRFAKSEAQPKAAEDQQNVEGQQSEGQSETEPKAADSDAPKQDAEAEAQTAAKALRKLKYRGREIEVDDEELERGYMMGRDYTERNTEFKQEKAQFYEKAKAEQTNALAAYEQRLDLHKQAVLKLSGAKTMAQIEELSKTDPAGAQQEFLRAIAVNQTVQAIEAEQQNIANQKKAEASESFAKQAREAVEKLQERIPGWNNDLYGKILKGAVDQYGFDAKDVNAINDHRAIEVLNDALKWREYQAAKPKTVEKRVAQVPKVQKPGTAEKPNPDADRFDKSMARLNKTGKREDAVDIVRQMIESGRL